MGTVVVAPGASETGMVAAAIERNIKRGVRERGIAVIRQRQRDLPAAREKQRVVAVRRAIRRALPRAPVVRGKDDRIGSVPRLAIERQRAFEAAGSVSCRVAGVVCIFGMCRVAGIGI